MIADVDRTFNLIIRAPIPYSAPPCPTKLNECVTIPNGNITTRVGNSWRRNKAWIYGADMGQFTITGPLDEMAQYFDSWLSYDVAETVSGGFVSWNGRIVRMTLDWGMMPLTVDMSDMWNAVAATVGDWAGTTTNGAYNWASINAYGARKKIIQTSVTLLSDAEEARDAFLAAHDWPKETTSGGSWYRGKRLDEASLTVHVAGYGTTINNRYAWDLTLTPYTKTSAAISEILSEAYYVKAQSIATNSSTIFEDINLIQAGDLMRKLLRVTDSSGNLFRGYIDGYRDFRYEIVTNEPSYYVKGGRVYGSGGSDEALNPRLLEPGIYRYLDLPLYGDHRDSFFADRRDVWIESIYIDGNGIANWQSSTDDVTEFTTRYWSETTSIR